MPTWLIITLAALALVLAWIALGWWQERRERQAYIATLSPDAAEQLRGAESVGQSWRGFRDLNAAQP